MLIVMGVDFTFAGFLLKFKRLQSEGELLEWTLCLSASNDIASSV